ncbi:hypothetical protein BpHYR1_011638, partial [Brachionus plicatilis]
WLISESAEKGKLNSKTINSTNNLKCWLNQNNYFLVPGGMDWTNRQTEILNITRQVMSNNVNFFVFKRTLLNFKFENKLDMTCQYIIQKYLYSKIKFKPNFHSKCYLFEFQFEYAYSISSLNVRFNFLITEFFIKLMSQSQENTFIEFNPPKGKFVLKTGYKS